MPGDDPTTIHAALEEILERALRGESLDFDVFCAAHPHWTHAQREQVRVLAEALTLDAAGALSRASALDLPSMSAVDAIDPERRQFGPYELAHELGRGAQGVVYLARDTRLSRRVALKILDRSASAFRTPGSPGGAAVRLKREAEIASKLEHPGICVVYELGVHCELPFIAMRYIEGETLAKKIDSAREARGPLRLAMESCVAPGVRGATVASAQRRNVMQCVELVERVARAMHVAHQAQVIHRDIKPANIMVTPTGEPVILDFGLARDEESDVSSLTLSGGVVGSPSYMSPEQIGAHSGALDARTDVYSLGIVLYECLTLRRPFEAPTREALYRAILNDLTPDARGYQPAIPRDLAVVLATALEKDRGRRYATALDLAEDLRRVREFEPILAKPASVLLRFRRWTQRSPAIAASLAGVFVTLGVVIAGLRISLARTRADADRIRFEQQLSASSLVQARDPAQALRIALGASNDRGDQSAAVNARLFEAWSALRERECVQQHESQLIEAHVSDDGRVLAASYIDGTVCAWDGRVLTTLKMSSKLNAYPHIALSRDGRRLATISHSDPLRVWETRTWTQHAFEVSTPVNRLDFAPNSRSLALTTTAGTVEVHDADTNAMIVTLAPRSSESASLKPTWGPDSEWLCIADEQSCSVWRLPESSARFTTHFAPINGPGGDFNRDGTLVAMPSETGVTVIDISGQMPPGEWRVPPVKLVRFDSTGGNLLLCYEHGGADLCPLDRDKPVTKLEDSRELVTAAQFHGGRLLLQRQTRSVIVWDVEAHRSVELSTTDPTSCAVFLGAGAELECITFHESGALRRWGLRSQIELSRIESAGKGAGVQGCSAAGDCLAIASGAVVRTYSLSTRELTAEFDSHRGCLNSVDISCDGRSIAFDAGDNKAVLLDTADPTQVVEFSQEKRIWATAFSPDGRHLAVAGELGVIELIDVERKRMSYELPGNGRGIRTLRFSPSGDQLVSVSEMEGCVRVWDLAMRAEIAQKRIGDSDIDHHGPVSACFCSDSRHVAIASRDGFLHLWDTERGTLSSHLVQHRGITDVACSPSGGMLALACIDQSVRLVGSVDAHPISTLPGHGDRVLSVRFATDGRSVVSQDALGIVFVWPVDLRSAAEDALRDIKVLADPQH